MATCWRLKKYAAGIRHELHQRLKIAEDARRNEFENAIKIQSWFRAEKVRAYIRHLHHCAIIIQKNFRAHVDRAIYRRLVQIKLQQMRQKYYDDMATKIQTQWRGYYVRKYIFNYYARKKYLLALVDRNELVRKELEVISMQRTAEESRQKEEKKQEAKEEESRKQHYLISTKVRPGIYASPLKRPQVSQRELELRAAKPLSTDERYMIARQKLARSLKSGYVDTSSELDRYLKRPESPEPLPPIPSTKVQGPFRNPASVLTQRYKRLEPTLRVATSYRSVEESRSKLKAEEWTKRVIEDKFLPFTKQQERYIPLLDKKTIHGRLAYGTKHFRDEDEQQRITEKPFQRFVSPIPVFEKLGKTY
eukprot:Seg1697.10_Seg1697.9 transcript_id=Seg1697.10_Seg1697.9/GoldUCD/mRNA.D3Y31 product="Spermatogenesis-associated protein 17" protein_id=Seg1697.10_Seg1697.9/GoldUCD/D3Y31